MKISKFLGVIILVFLLTVSHSVLAKSNEAEDFYKNKVDKNDYEEFVGANLKVRKLIMVQDLSKVFDEKVWKNYPSVWKKYLKKDIIENTKDLAPNQQVFYFFSLKDDGEKIYIKDAMYDANTQKIRSKGGGHWTKEEFKRKFEQR